jgi:hypothetical protein
MSMRKQEEPIQRNGRDIILCFREEMSVSQSTVQSHSRHETPTHSPAVYTVRLAKVCTNGEWTQINFLGDSLDGCSIP